jgi:preprotein translocase subunit SecD
MDRSLRWRSIILLGIVAFCVLNLLPSLVGKKALPKWFSNLSAKEIQLGLDLQGGLHIVYSIDLDKAVDDKASEIKRDIEGHFEEDKVDQQTYKVSTPSALGAVTVRVTDDALLDPTRSWVLSTYRGVVVERACPESDPERAHALCFRVSSDYADSIKRAALAQAIETIRSRIDEKGVAEPTVVSKGDDIIVELPGIDDERIEETKDIIARTAKLEFKAVISDDPYMKDLYKQVKSDPDAAAAGIDADTDGWRHDDTGKYYADYFLMAKDKPKAVPVDLAKERGCWTEDMEEKDGMVYCAWTGRQYIEDYLAALAAKDPKFAVPDDRQIAYEKTEPGAAAEQKDPFWRTYFLDRAVKLSGSAISNAVTIWDPQTNRPEVLVEFNRYGTRVFGDLTTQQVGRKMAIILDDVVKSAPVIQSSITGGRSNISMGGGGPDEQQKEADALVTVLKTGSLPAPLREESHAKLGPTLGNDAIQKTKVSFALGVLLVLFIMLAIYRYSGLIAIGALLINLLITLSAMAVLGATLTLPGIAALVLTVGMAVDGNIIIYERIRDELHLGKSVKGAVDIGFARAFTTVLDGHVTTAAAGWVLLQYGSGPIQGFATMLLVGIATTLFTTTWVSRVFFDWYVAKNKNSGTISI